MQVATPLRLVAYVGFAAFMVILFYGIGNKATTVTNNVTMFFAISCVCVFQSVLPAAIVCEYFAALLTHADLGSNHVIKKVKKILYYSSKWWRCVQSHYNYVVLQGHSL